MTSGIYIFIKNFDILYIGASSNVEDRISGHKIRNYDYFIIIPCEENRPKIESDMIFEYKPILNRLHKHKARIGTSFIK